VVLLVEFASACSQVQLHVFLVQLYFPLLLQKRPFLLDRLIDVSFDAIYSKNDSNVFFNSVLIKKGNNFVKACSCKAVLREIIDSNLGASWFRLKCLEAQNLVL
jgi:hypothetical protein